jgi:hypothetical protein
LFSNSFFLLFPILELFYHLIFLALMLVPNTNADAQLLPPYHLATPLLTEEQSVTTTN